MTRHVRAEPSLFPSLHVRPAQGWVNDPNGIGHWNGRWHVMYQWNPDSPQHADIHWGHMSSADLLRWQDEGAALRPRAGRIDAAGAWSGVAVPETEGVALVYTAVSGDARTACVAVARRDANGTWVQPDRAAAEHADHDRWTDVRDPFVVRVDGRRLGIVGAGLTSGDPGRARGGVVLVYSADDLDDWNLLGTLVVVDELPEHMLGRGAIWECPQLVPFGARWLLVVSWDDGAPALDSAPEAAPQRRQGVTGYVGDLDLSGAAPRFVAEIELAFDHGPDFYAPQLVVDGDRLLAWGWSWEGRGSGANRRSDAEIAASGWAGTLTFPREVVAGPGGEAMCRPARELAALVGDSLEVRSIEGRYEMRTDEPAWRLTSVGDVEVDLADEATGAVRTVWSGGASGIVSVFVDGSIVEVFDGTGSTTLRAYPTVGEIWRARTSSPADAAMLRLPPA